MAGDRMEKPYEPCDSARRIHVFEGKETCHCGKFVAVRDANGKYQAMPAPTVFKPDVQELSEPVKSPGNEDRLKELEERIAEFEQLWGKGITATELQNNFNRAIGEKNDLLRKALRQEPVMQSLAVHLFIAYLGENRGHNAVSQARFDTNAVLKYLHELGGLSYE